MCYSATYSQNNINSYIAPSTPNSVGAFGTKSHQGEIKVYAINGKLLWYKNIAKGEEINLQFNLNLSSGLYFVSISAENKVLTHQKLIIIN